MRTLRFVALGLWAVAVPGSAADAPRQSWGKPGVSAEQYRADALECGIAAYLDKGLETADGQALVTASQRVEGILARGEGVEAYAEAAQEAASVRPPKKLKALEQRQQGILDGCLRQRGYSQFALTGKQRSVLKKLKEGSAERRAYLLSLASDPVVLARQPVDER